MTQECAKMIKLLHYYETYKNRLNYYRMEKVLQKIVYIPLLEKMDELELMV